MKNLLMLAGLGVLGYFGYHEWFSRPEPKTAAVETKPEPVNFAVKSRVRKLLGEWQRRELGTPAREQGTATLDPSLELTEVRKALFRDQARSEAAVSEVIKRALRELGVAENELDEVSNGILGMR